MNKPLLLLAVLTLVLAGPAAKTPAESYEALLPLLVDLPGWKARPAHVLNQSSSEVRNVAAIRSYESGERRLDVYLQIGTNAIRAWDLRQFQTRKIADFLVFRQFNPGDRSGTIIVVLNDSIDWPEMNAVLAIECRGLPLDQALSTAQRFSWPKMKDQVGKLKADWRWYTLSDAVGAIRAGSSSRLAIAGDKDTYAPRNLFDGRRDTAWAEGVEGDGIGQQVWFTVDRGTRKLTIINGFAGSNRVKRLEASLWIGVTREVVDDQEQQRFWAKPASVELSLTLADTADSQTMALPFDWAALREDPQELLEEFRAIYEYNEYFACWTEYIVCLEIKEVYRSRAGRAAGLTEISWTVPPGVAGPGGRRAADLAGWWKAEAGAPWDVLHLELKPGYRPSFDAWHWDRNWQPTGEAYEQPDTFVLASGYWFVGDGRLKLESESGRSWIYTSGRLSGDTLYLIGQDGHQETYARPDAQEEEEFDSFSL